MLSIPLHIPSETPEQKAERLAHWKRKLDQWCKDGDMQDNHRDLLLACIEAGLPLQLETEFDHGRLGAAYARERISMTISRNNYGNLI